MSSPKSILNPESESYQFYFNILEQLHLNAQLHAMGICKLVKDMTETEHQTYTLYVQQNANEGKK